MSLPIQAVNLHGDGNPWFPYRSEQEGAVRFTNHPTLPAGEDHRWCTVPDGFPHPALSLDLPNLANLMYLSQIPTEVLDETRVAGLLEHELSRCCCDQDRLIRVVSFEYGDQPELFTSHFTSCLELASQLLGSPV